MTRSGPGIAGPWARGSTPWDSGAYRLVVIHLQEVDDAGHRHGTASPRYDEAVRRCDEAIESVRRATPTGYALLVTSDHGCLASGAHVGPEPEVLDTPVVAVGDGWPVGDLGEIRQRDLHGLLRGAWAWEDGRGIPARATGPDRGADPGRRLPLALTWIILALMCGVRLWSGVGGASQGPRKPPG